MRKLHWAAAAVVIGLMLGAGGCLKETDSGHGEHDHSHGDGQVHEHSHASGERGEHDSESHEHDGESGEESGTQLGLDETYNATRNGAQLYLAFHADDNSFVGWVKNNTSETLKRVRVEVHLSNSKELGPTEPTDLAPGQQIEVKLTATSTGFTGWSAHPEVGSSEHSHGEDGHEHGGESHEHNEHGEHI